jgi:hypothetical protein
LYFQGVALRDDRQWELDADDDSRLAIGPDAGFQLIDQAGATPRLGVISAAGMVEALANPGSAGTYGAADKTLVQTIERAGEPGVRVARVEEDDLKRPVAGASTLAQIRLMEVLFVYA